MRVNDNPPISSRFLILRMAGQIKALDDKMQEMYDKLASNLSEATVHPETFDKILGFLLY